MTQTGYPRPSGGSPDFPALEREVLDYWAADDTFRASIAQRDGAPEYVFYDGPPFANGLPHYGHLLTGYVKDIVPRYRTMRGYKVERRFGWDTHGLPAELEVQRQLGITDKAQIEADGHREVQRRLPRLGAQVHRRVARLRHPPGPLGRLRQRLQDPRPVVHGVGHLGVQTAVGQGPGLRGRAGAAVLLERRDPAVQPRAADGRRRLPAAARTRPSRSGSGSSRPDSDLDGAYLLVWTTTPWTLPSNQAVAVNPEVDVRRRRVHDQAPVVLAAGAAGGLRPRTGGGARGPGHAAPGSSCSACATCRRSRTSPTPPNAFQVLRGDFVTTEDGTGIVHMAPAYGEDDKATTDTVGIVPVTPVDAKGRFDASVPDYPGQQVFDANPQIIRDLKNGTGGGGGQRAGAAPPRDLRPPLPALLAVPQPADLPGGVVVVRQGHRVPRPDGGAQPADHLVSRARQGRPVRQVARPTPATGRSRETATGARRSRCGSPTTRPIRASTSTAASTSSSATSGCARTTCTGPTSTN